MHVSRVLDETETARAPRPPPCSSASAPDQPAPSEDPCALTSSTSKPALRPACAQTRTTCPRSWTSSCDPDPRGSLSPRGERRHRLLYRPLRPRSRSVLGEARGGRTLATSVTSSSSWPHFARRYLDALGAYLTSVGPRVLVRVLFERRRDDRHSGGASRSSGSLHTWASTSRSPSSTCGRTTPTIRPPPGAAARSSSRDYLAINRIFLERHGSSARTTETPGARGGSSGRRPLRPRRATSARTSSSPVPRSRVDNP